MSTHMMANQEIFIGRKQEISIIGEEYNRTLAESRPSFILIKGDFGVGKTELVKEFLRKNKQIDTEALVGKGYCSMEQDSNGLIPFSQIIKEICEQELFPEIVGKNILNFLKDTAPAWLDIITLNLATPTVALVEAGVKNLSRTSLTQDNVFVQYTNLLVKLARKKPIIAVIEDLHWADDTSLSLLFHLKRNLDNIPILFICTARVTSMIQRNEIGEKFQEIYANLIRYGAREIELSNGIDVVEYSQKRYPNNLFPDYLLKKIQEVSGGHPLFISELYTGYELKQDVIVASLNKNGDAVWSFSENVSVESIKIPDSIHGVINQRLQNLPDKYLEILKCCSVEGVQFSDLIIQRVIKKVMDIDEIETIKIIDELVRKFNILKFIDSQELNDDVIDRYEFKHKLYREYIYDVYCGKSLKRIYHREIGELLERLYLQRSEISSRLVEHFYRGNLYSKCLEYVLIAVNYELHRFAYAECDRLIKLGFELLQNKSSIDEKNKYQLKLLVASGTLKFSCSDYLGAFEDFHNALELSDKLKSKADVYANIYSYLFDISDMVGESIEASIEYAEKCYQYSAKMVEPDPSLLLVARAAILYFKERKGDTSNLIEDYQDIINSLKDLPQNDNVKTALAQTYNYYGIALANLGNSTAAIEAFDTSIMYSEKLGDLLLKAIPLGNKADEYLNLGLYEACKLITEECIEIAEKYGNLDNLAYAYATRGAVFLETNEFEKAKDDLENGICISEKVNAYWNMHGMLSDLAVVYMKKGELKKAHETAKKAVEFANKSNYKFDLGYALTALARIESDILDYHNARRHFLQAISLLEESGYVNNLARSKMHYGEMLIKVNDIDGSKNWLSQAKNDFEAINLVKEVEKIEKILKRILI